MIVTCPHCSTHFKVPEAALGASGRMMKCARCGHVWRAMADPAPRAMTNPAPRATTKTAPPRMAEAMPREEIPLESPPTRQEKQAALSRDEVTERMFADHDMAGDLALSEIDALGFRGEGSGPLNDLDDDDPFSKMSELMRARQPKSAPDAFIPKPPKPPKPMPRRKGGFILWIVPLFVLAAAILTGLYFFQDRIIDHWPGFAKYYEQVGVRRDDIGVGLAFRNYSSERSMQDNAEVLIVRGVIANNSEARHDIPLLRLALYNGQTLLQEKIVSPPQAALDAHATVGFRVTLDQPDANATRFEVTFTAPKPASK